jgi:predicted nucleic acid-binding protein
MDRLKFVLDTTEENHIRNLLKTLKVIPLNRRVEKNTIRLRRATALKAPDAIIAATALTVGATLISRDKQLLGLNWPGLTVINAI